MLESLFWTIVGWLGGFLMPGNFWGLSWVRQLRAQRDWRRLEDSLASARGQFTVGSLEIKQLTAVQIFQPPGLAANEIVCHFNPTPQKLPPDLEDLEINYLPTKRKKLIDRGKTVDLNNQYALRALRIERPQELETGRRRNRPVLSFEPSNFKYYLIINDELNTQFLKADDGSITSIRQKYLSSLKSFEWTKLGEVPFHMWFATVTAVITADDQLVVAIRSEMQAISDAHYRPNWWRTGMSCAEGMLRPVDSEPNPTNEEKPSPFCTALRSLQDELGLTVGGCVSESDLRLIGIGFDTQRFQPVAVFMVKLQNYKFMDVYNLWEADAKDHHENLTLLHVPMARPGEVTRLLRGQFSHEGRPVRLFSNHQQFGALLAAIHCFGYRSVSAWLA